MFFKNHQQYIHIFRLTVSIFAVCTAIFLSARYIHVLADVLIYLFKIFLPFIIGIFFSLILNIPLCFFEKHLNFNINTKKSQKRKRCLCILFSFLLVFGILLFAAFLLLPDLSGALVSLIDFTSLLADYLYTLEHTNDYPNIPFVNFIHDLSIPWDRVAQKLSNIIPSLTETLAKMFPQILTFAFDILLEIFIGLIFAIYILSKKELLKSQAHMLLEIWIPLKWNSLIFHILNVFIECFRNFVVGQSTEAFILTLLCGFGMFFLRLPFALTVSVLVGITSLLPYVGAYLGAFIGSIIILTISPWKAFAFLIFLFILQQIEGNLIYPKIVGNKINLPSLWVLFSLTVGGRIAGPIGMFLGVPTFAALYRLLKEVSVLKKHEKLIS